VLKRKISSFPKNNFIILNGYEQKGKSQPMMGWGQKVSSQKVRI